MTMEPAQQPPTARSSFLRSLVAVLWSFAGIRKSSDHKKDLQTIRPEHAIIAGILVAIVFVVSLILIVQYVLSSAART